jgi:hypothetical protein
MLRRQLFILASALSLLLSVATAALWVRSYWVHDVVYRWHPAGGWVFSSDLASLYFMWWKGDSPTIGSAAWQWERLPHTRQQKKFEFHRQRQSYISDLDGQSVWETDRWVQFPHWAAFTVLFPLPLLAGFHRIRQSKPRRANLCLACGYDLRATPDRCPECGTIVPKKATA